MSLHTMSVIESAYFLAFILLQQIGSPHFPGNFTNERGDPY
jgi:hypothetical protein